MKVVPYKIALVEDEIDLQVFLKQVLNQKGYEVTTFSDGNTALKSIKKTHFDLLILDWMVPQKDGLEILKVLRHSTRATLVKVPVLFLTAKDQTQDIVNALEKGADDYLTKPFELEELLARVQALLRRVLKNSTLNAKSTHAKSTHAKSIHAKSTLNAKSTTTLEGFECSFEKFTVRTPKGVLCVLTPTEFHLLVTLLSHKNKVLTREELLFSIYGIPVHLTTRTIDTHMVALRKKLRHFGTFIHTIRSKGYCYEPSS